MHRMPMSGTAPASAPAGAGRRVGLIAGLGPISAASGRGPACARFPDVYCLGVHGHGRPAACRVVPRFPVGSAWPHRRRHHVLQAAWRDRGHDGRQGPQGAALPALAMAAAPARPADRADVHSAFPYSAEGLPRRLAAGGDLRRVCPRGDSFRAGHRLRAGVAGERGPADPLRPFGLRSGRTSISAGRWPRRWGGSTSARAWP